MKILIASDKFKDALTQAQVNTCISEVITALKPESDLETVSLSDGGDGFLKVVQNALPDIDIISQNVSDPLGRNIRASYLYDPANRKAYFELAEASGLSLLKEAERKVMNTSTLGTGELIKHALEKGAKSLYIGLGGSATNDAGTGIAHALGFRFLDRDEHILQPCGANLSAISHIVIPDHFLEDAEVFAVNDVSNPLYGPEGAAWVYAAQKGGTPEDIEMLDQGLRNISHVVNEIFKKDLAHINGSGAAGGTAFGLMAFLDASFINGAEFILDLQGVTKRLQTGAYDLVITGEGSIDDQTYYGKLISGLAGAAGKGGTPVIAFCGVNALKQRNREDLGLHQIIEISDPNRELSYNLRHAEMLLKSKALEFFRTYLK
ncbi:glycerate kinase [Robertkochia flava]|uniref:glycerate kinase n=1 Tax=Robertkochia flava TaxID=3447986 RepID=UPI001CCFFF88|nr:glycerate kinase [Robertkochia marina]